MIRCVVLFVPLFCYPFALATAQFSIGLAGGANLSFRHWEIQSLSPPVELGHKPGLAGQAQLLGEWRGGAAISLRAEAGLQIWRSSYDAEFTVFSSAVYRGLVHDDLETWYAALLLRLTPLKNRSYYLLTGPSVAAVSLNRIRFKDDLPQALGISQLRRTPGESHINATLYLVNIGAGAILPFDERLKGLIELRYQFGINNLSTADTVNAGSSSVVLNAGILFVLSGTATAK